MVYQLRIIFKRTRSIRRRRRSRAVARPPGGVSALSRLSFHADSLVGVAGNPAASRAIRNARIQNICKYHSCMVSHLANRHMCPSSGTCAMRPLRRSSPRPQPARPLRPRSSPAGECARICMVEFDPEAVTGITLRTEPGRDAPGFATSDRSGRLAVTPPRSPPAATRRQCPVAWRLISSPFVLRQP